LRVEQRERRSGILAIATGSVPRSAFPTSQWVASVVDDRVEPVLALHEVSHSCPPGLRLNPVDNSEAAFRA
jgi:hypothetical protein